MASQDMNVVEAADVRLELDDSGTSVRGRCCMQSLNFLNLTRAVGNLILNQTGAG